RFITAPRLKQRPNHREVRAPGAGQLDLLRQGRHPGPRIEYVGDAVPAQRLEVRRIEIFPVPDLHSEVPSNWKCGDKILQSREELGLRKVDRSECTELEHDDADLAAVRLQRAKKRSFE